MALTARCQPAPAEIRKRKSKGRARAGVESWAAFLRAKSHSTTQSPTSRARSLNHFTHCATTYHASTPAPGAPRHARFDPSPKWPAQRHARPENDRRMPQEPRDTMQGVSDAQPATQGLAREASTCSPRNGMHSGRSFGGMASSAETALRLPPLFVSGDPRVELYDEVVHGRAGELPPAAPPRIRIRLRRQKLTKARTRKPGTRNPPGYGSISRASQLLVTRRHQRAAPVRFSATLEVVASRHRPTSNKPHGGAADTSSTHCRLKLPLSAVE